MAWKNTVMRGCYCPSRKEQLKKIDKGDTNKAGPRTPAVTIHWSKDSKKFALEREDNRKVGDYWVIHSLANPRPILEARSYPLPGEANMPVSEIDIFDVASNSARWYSRRISWMKC